MVACLMLRYVCSRVYTYFCPTLQMDGGLFLPIQLQMHGGEYGVKCLYADDNRDNIQVSAQYAYTYTHKFTFLYAPVHVFMNTSENVHVRHDISACSHTSTDEEMHTVHICDCVKRK